MPTLNWIGKEAVVNHHREVPYHLLRCDEKLSVGDPGSGNLLVLGNNLLALKALLPYYAGQVISCNMDIKNPNSAEALEHRPPEELVADILAKEQRIIELMGEIRSELQGGRA